MPCDKVPHCNKPMTVYLTEIKNGKKIEKHLCKDCPLVNEGLPVKSHTPINELLTNFVLAHSGTQQTEKTCPHCGITWRQFKEAGLLGCEHDYELFETELTPLLQRAHEGGTHHVGKVPARRGGTGKPAKKRVSLNRLRRELQQAVEDEDYELAAKLRDQIKNAGG